MTAGDSLATTLTFDIFNAVHAGTENYPEGFAVNQEYGDRVTALNDTATDGVTTFEYGADLLGFTPNIQALFGPGSIFTGGPQLWRYDFGDLTRVLYQGSAFPDPANPLGFDYDYLEVTLFADPGYDVLLYGFDLGGWPQTDYTVDEVAVKTTGLTTLFSDTNVTVKGAGPDHTSYSFAAPIRAPFLTILIDSRNLGADSLNVGIDNIRFGQDLSTTPVPEPASATLLLVGTAFISSLTRRHRARSRQGSETCHL